MFEKTEITCLETVALLSPKIRKQSEKENLPKRVLAHLNQKTNLSLSVILRPEFVD